MEKLILPDGTAIGSGVWGEPAICQVIFTQNRNQGSQLTLGSACPAELEILIFSPQKPEIPVGTRLIFQENAVTRGIFYCQSLERKSKHRWALYAQDAMVKFCREVPNLGDVTVLSAVQRLCEICGVGCAVTQLPGGDLTVPSMEGLSGLELLHMLGQAAGRYFYIDREENLRDGWYEQIQAVDNYYELTVAEFTTDPIERVWLRQSRTDAGSIFPDGENMGNTLILEGNPIFSGDVQFVAQRILGQLASFRHTPFTCKLLPGQEVSPGCLVEFTDPDGVTRTGAVMQWEKKNGVCTIRGVGSQSFQSVQAFNRLTLQDLSRQTLNLERTAKGLQVSHSDLRGNVGALELSLGGLQSRVTAVEDAADTLTTQTTQLRQNASGLSLSVSQLTGALDGKTDRAEFSQVTEHFLFDAAGMTIKNSGSGMGIQVSENQVAFTGGENPSTVVRPDNMETARLTVEKRLDMGAFSFLPRTSGNLSLRFTEQE